jgi:2'-hydroxyisoflavone reductase
VKLLVLGGTRFLGRHLVERACAEGHAVTVFHRGASGCTIFPQVEHVHGDRDGDLDLLAGREWDVVVDTCGYVPRLVRDAAQRLRGAAGIYVFVSSISVYAKAWRGMDESGPLASLEDPFTEVITGETYGGLKVLCEKAVEETFAGPVLQVRSGLIVGPHDPTDRFTYWVRRIARGGQVLVPDPPDRPLQFIHAADLARWMLEAAGAGRSGAYNVSAPALPVTMREFFETCRKAAASDAEAVWLSEDLLRKRDVVFWSDLPLCSEAAEADLLAVGVDKAVGAGLAWRPVSDTVVETRAWDEGRGSPPLTAGLSAEREAELLALAL